MARKKVKIAFIRDAAARKITFKKRKRGFLKKLDELGTLCGIEACAIIYSPFEPQPEVWPSPHGIHPILAQFKNMPTIDQSKKMVTQESFLRQRIQKAIDQTNKQRRENRVMEIEEMMFQGLVGRSLFGMNIEDLNDLSWIMDDHLKDILKREETLLKGNANPTDNIVIDDNNNNSQARAMAVVAPIVPGPMEDTTMMDVSSPAKVVGVDVGVGTDVGETMMIVTETPPSPEAVSEQPRRSKMSDSQQCFMNLINPSGQIPFGGGPVSGANELMSFFDQNRGGFK